MNIFIHIGSPRTGTSYLRKCVFPFLRNTQFYNKQAIKSENESSVIEYFQRLAHFGDGDETSSNLVSQSLPKFCNLDGTTPRNVLISEEHFIWSVYHMMGNIGSRALILKQHFPNAKIILTIRRQPELIISIYKYLCQFDNPHLKNQMRNIFNFSNLYEEISNISISFLNYFPVGINIYKKLCLTDIQDTYFERRQRHFISADMSWLRIFRIYSELFGKENILVLPQEMLLRDSTSYFSLLNSFIGTEICHSDHLNRIENKSPDMKVFRSESEKLGFIEYVKDICCEDNEKLDLVLKDVRLEEYGYCDKGSSNKTWHQIGFKGNREKYLDKRFYFEKYKYIRRLGIFRYSLVVVNKIRKKIISLAIKIIRNFLNNTYNKINLFVDALSEKDYSKIESVETLKLDYLQAKQYEKTKIFELKRWMKYIPKDISFRAIDFGSGKGAVLNYFSKLDYIEFIYGVEISRKLIAISKNNLTDEQLCKIKLIHDNAKNVTEEIIDSCNLFYFYNPFPENVMLDVINKVEDSLIRKPRFIYIIYFNPKYSSVIEDKPNISLYKKIKNPLSRASTKIYISSSVGLS